ncbi:hypothetical protein FB45DRAFT_137048 [Roridomyces roridus]|uniref:Uncharacterized protein n=1 Tax=Roridomyces roridus TaxID=1738132 RepID=A0AAD7BHK0_9AGAR|nr:hypothetical protein FB45DRAFT_137048 [Roridomyces roridus]
MLSLFKLVTLLALTTPSFAGSSCIAFDASMNLLLFNGNQGKDYNAGTSDTWASGTAKDITTTGRPPFNGSNVKCYLAQFFNAIYVLGADTANANDIYIYDAGASSWSQQHITAPSGFDPTNFQAILDHDTNVIYGLSGGETFSLDMGELKAAQSSSIAWLDQGVANITTTNYNPVMAIAQNHIFFYGVPNIPAGSLNIFVIHFAFWQPDAQPFTGSAQFPDSHGQATSFFLDSAVQENIAFIPDDGSQTFISNVQTNTTSTMPGPTIVDASATYFASEKELVQLASSGAVSWIPFNPSDTSANSGAKWSTVQSLASVAPPSGGSSSGSSAGSSASASGNSVKGGATGSATKAAGGSSTPSGSATGSAPSSSGSSTASREVVWGSGLALSLAGVALSLL